MIGLWTPFKTASAFKSNCAHNPILPFSYPQTHGEVPINVFLCALEVVLSKLPSPTRCEGYSLTCGQMIKIQTLH